MRRVALPLALGLALLGGCGGAAAAPTVRVYAAGRLVAAGTGPALVRRVERLPVRYRVVRGRAELTQALDRRAAVAAVRRGAAAGAARVELPLRTVAARIDLPVERQALRNDCEATALSILLAGAGLHVGQLELQRRLPTSGPLDPVPRPDGLPLWGDPARGFVGRADGGGTAGGFGVYERPVLALARRLGAPAVDLTGAGPAAVYRTLLSGRPVLAWVGLSDGPYRRWRAPDGRIVVANMGEHAVVLAGIAGRTLVVDDPLAGAQATWTRSLFELRWRLLGRRALTLR